jgi:hypothetical protein
MAAQVPWTLISRGRVSVLETPTRGGALMEPRPAPSMIVRQYSPQNKVAVL